MKNRSDIHKLFKIIKINLSEVAYNFCRNLGAAVFLCMLLEGGELGLRLIAIVLCVAMLLQITNLATSGDNQQARRKAIMDIFATGIGSALLLGFATIVM